jgi:hypothetical protein
MPESRHTDMRRAGDECDSTYRSCVQRVYKNAPSQWEVVPFETGRQHAANLATRPGDARAPRDGRGMAPIVDSAAEDLEWTIVNRRLKALRLAGVLTVRAR